MEDGEIQARSEAILNDLRRGVEFHASSFQEIDDKAKYWLTVCVPSLIGLTGYGLQQGTALNPYLIALISAVAFCLFFTVFFLAKAIGSTSVSAGIALPEDQKADSILYYTQSGENWGVYEKLRIANALNALVANEQTNNSKGKWLIRAEALLFRGTPASACIACAGTALVNSCVTHGWWVAATTVRPSPGTAIVTGIAAGVGTGAALWIIAHFRTSKVSTLSK